MSSSESMSRLRRRGLDRSPGEKVLRLGDSEAGLRLLTWERFRLLESLLAPFLFPTKGFLLAGSRTVCWLEGCGFSGFPDDRCSSDRLDAGPAAAWPAPRPSDCCVAGCPAGRGLSGRLGGGPAADEPAALGALFAGAAADGPAVEPLCSSLRAGRADDGAGADTFAVAVADGGFCSRIERTPSPSVPAPERLVVRRMGDGSF